MTATGPLRVAVAACGAYWEAAALAEIEAASAVVLVRRCVDVADLLATAETHRVDVALVAIDTPGLDVGVVDRLAVLGVGCCAVEADGSHLGIERTARLGTLAAVGVAPVAPRRSHGGGRLVAVWGPTGAPGRSTLAVSIAASAAASGHPTALVDADLHGGVVGQLLGVLDEVSGIMATCRDVNRGRRDTADAHLLAVSPRLHVLTGLPRSDMWHHVRADALGIVLGQLRETHDLVVVDCGFGVEHGTGAGPWRDHVTRKVLEIADDVVAVGRVDPVGLARLVRSVADAGPWSRPPRLVLNGFRAGLGWSEREVAATVRELTGITPWAFLPHDVPGHDAAIMAGRPMREVAPTSGYVSRVDRLVADLAITPTPSRPAGGARRSRTAAAGRR